MIDRVQFVDEHPRLLPCALTVVVPVYRNADTLAELTQRLHAALDSNGIDHRILMVDDNSPDGSWQILDKLCYNDNRLAAVKLSANLGQQHALFIGLSLSTDSAWVAVIDADLQDPPEILPAMYEKGLSTDGPVFAERFGKYERWDRMLSSVVFKSLSGLISGLPHRCGTFFIAPRHLVACVLDFPVVTPHLPIMMRIATDRFATVPFVRLCRPRGKSAYNFYRRCCSAYDCLRCAIACRLKKKIKLPVTNRLTSKISMTCGYGWAT